MTSMLWLAMTGCFLFGNNDDEVMETGDTDEEDEVESVPMPDPPLAQSRVIVFAVFRYDATTALPGDWSDADGNAGLSALEFLVGDDQFNGAQGTACTVQLPIEAEGARLITDLEASQFWGVTLDVDPADAITNCADPQFERISEFYGGEVVEFLTTNRDDTPAEFGIIVEEPRPDAFTWVNSQFDVPTDEVLGGIIQLSDRWAQAEINAVAAFGVETDGDGQIVLDDEDEPTPITIDTVFANPGILEGVYNFFGYEITLFTN